MRKLEAVLALRELADELIHVRVQINNTLSGLESTLYRMSVELRKGAESKREEGRDP